MVLFGFDNVFSSNLNNELLDSLIEFFDYELLCKGNYFNSSLGEISPRGYDYSKLKESSNQHYVSGEAWEGFRSNWIWQSGVTPPSGMTPPLVGTNKAIPGISGVYICSSGLPATEFYPSSTTGVYKHKVDYFNGRIIFDTPVTTTSTGWPDVHVKAEFSYKYINILYASNLPYIREIQYRTMDKSSFFHDNDKGDYEIPAEMRLQLPAIAIEVVPTRSTLPVELGNAARKFVSTDVIFHCLAEDDMTRNQLVDIVSLQGDNRVMVLNSDKIAKSGAFPINYQGVPNSGALSYPELSNQYGRSAMRLVNPRVQGMDMINSNLYGGTVRITTEFIK
jgi:hypothetical protein